MTAKDRLPEGIRRPLRTTRASVRSVVHAGGQPVLTARLLIGPNLRHAESAVWRRLLADGIVAVALVVIGAVSAIATATWWVAAVVPLAFLASAARRLWNARPWRGVGQGLPPGRLDRGAGWITSPNWFAEQAAAHGTVFKSNFYDAPTICTTDLALGTRLLREHPTELGPPWAPYDRFVPGGSVRGAEGERHAELRRIYARALSPPVVKSWEPLLAAHARVCLDGLVDECAASGTVNPREAVRRCVVESWCAVLLGIPPSVPAFAEVRELFDRLDPDRHFYAEPFPDDDVEVWLARIGQLVVEGARRPDAPHSLARQFDGAEHALDDPAVLRNVIYSVVTSRDDVAGLLVWVLWYLAADAEWSRALRDASGETGPDREALADRIVSETIRLEQSEFLMRRAHVDFEHEGVTVPADWYVRVCIREIHRDPATFPEPERFDPARHADGGCGRDVYSPFGVDHRACLGELLTRTFAREFAFRAAAYDLVTRADGPVELSRQRHWSPSSRWRLEVVARATSGLPGTS